MFRRSVIVTVIAVTFSAAVLAAVIGSNPNPAASRAIGAEPVVTLEPIVIYGERASLSSQTPEQVATGR